MTPHHAACAAARAATDLMPDDTQAPVVQWVGPAGVLSVILPSLDHALGLIDTAEQPAAMSEAITVVADSYHATVDYDPADPQATDAALAIERGDVAARFEAGDPTVSEAITVVTVHRTPPTADMTVMPYRRHPRPGWPTRIEWGPAIDHHGSTVVELQGRVADTLRAALGPTRYWMSPDTELAACMHLATLLAGVGLPAEVTPRPEQQPL